MPGRIVDHLTVATAIGCGISGGVFFAFSTFVMPALRALPHPTGMTAMQAMNRKAPNPLFMTALFGSALGCLTVAIAASVDLPERRAVYQLTAAAIYLAGVVLTVAYHVPRNDALAAVRPDTVDSAQTWTRYAAAWTNANHLRALTSITAATLLTLAARAT
ncbi:MAG: DUF1772 domain-containing protein [Acidimicrobiales bacterium]